MLLNGGGKGVMYSSDAQGKMVASLSGTIYSHDSATSDVFVVAAQSGVKDYNNALRGFRHGIDKIDLRQTGVTDFSQLTIEHKNRATLNGLTQIHGVYVTRNGAQGADSNVNLLYLDALDVAQVSASDFIFAEHAPQVVAPVGPVVAPVEQPTVTVPGTLTPIVERPGVDKPVVVPPLPPVDLHPTVSVPVVDPVLKPSVTIPDITLPEHKTIEQILAERGVDLNPKVPEHKTVEQILAERGGNQGPTVPEHKTIEQILAERGVGSLQPSKLPDIGPVGRDQGGRTPVDVPSPRPIVIPDIPVVDTSHRDLDIPSRPRVTVPDIPTASNPWLKFDDPVPSVTDTEDFSFASIRDRIRSRPTPTTVDPVTSSSRDPLTLSPLPSVDPAPVASDPNTMTVKGFFANVSLGDESKTINVEASSAKLVAGNGDNKVNVTGSRAEITLGNGNNVIAGDINKLTVGHGNNSITDSGSFATVKLGDGNNKVVVSGSMPTVEVGHGVNDLEFSGSMGQLVFGQDISPERLWFQHEGQDLQISVIGSQQEVTLHNWYAATPERPRDIMTGDRHRLLGNDVENLVQAMAAFAPAAPATMTFGAAEQQALQPVLAANWT